MLSVRPSSISAYFKGRWSLSLSIVSLILFHFTCIGVNASPTDSLLALLKTAREDTNKVNILYGLSEIAEADQDFYNYALQSLHLAQKLKYQKGVANAYNNIGGYYYNMFNYPAALENYKMGLSIRESISDQLGIAQSLNNIGTVYEKQGNVVAALEHYHKGLKIRETIGALNEVAVSLDNIALFYKSQGDLSNAMKYLQKSRQIRESLKDEQGLAISMINIGFLFQEQREPENALRYFKNSLSLFEKYGNKQYTAMALHNIGWTYSLLEMNDLALEHYEQSLKILSEIGDRLTMSASLNNIGRIYFKKKNYKKAEDFCLRSLELATALGIPDRIKNTSESLSQIYAVQGDYKKAYEMQVLFKKMTDSINNVETRKSSLKKQMEYEAEKKEQQITLLNKDNEIQKRKISQQTLLRNTAIVISAFLLVIGFLFYNRARTNKKYSLVLEEKNKIIEEEKEKAVRSELYKTQFLANMSHEIRTPLHAITGMINVLNQRSPREDQSAYLNVMRKSSDNLIGIINNVLDISKIEAGKIDFEKINFSPAETLDTVVNLLQANALDKGLYLKSNSIGLPARVMGDQIRLTQVIINLIGNAIKFTTHGGVTVSGEALPLKSVNPGMVLLQFSIEDTGVGIQEDKLEKIFESFSQADEGITRKYGGTGLGLTISKQLVELQGGTIRVSSEPGKGTVFSFTIPYGAVMFDELQGNSDLDLSTDSLNGSRILVVEDNRYNRIVAKETLNMLIEGITIDEAENGLVALERIKENKYDYIFMDLQMPEMDGYTAMKTLGENMSLHIKHSIIIGLSANSSTDEKDKCIAAGMQNYLSKPFNPKDLLKVMLESHAQMTTKDDA